MTATKESTALVPAPAGAIAPASMGPFGDLELQLYSSIPADTPENRGRIIGLMQGKASPLADMIGKTITVEHVLAHTVEVADQKTGELSAQLRIVLVNGEQAWSATSKGVRDSIRLLAKFLGQPPWKGGIKLKVDQVSTRRGFRTFTLTPV